MLHGAAARTATGTATLTQTVTMTMPSETATKSGTATGSQTVTATKEGSTTQTFPTQTASPTLTLSLPTSTSTLTLPTTSATVTFSLPTSTASLTLPSATVTATVTVSMPTHSGTETPTLLSETNTITLPVQTSSMTVTLTATHTVSSTATVTVSLPTRTQTLSTTRTASGSATVTRTLTVTMPTVTGTGTATVTSSATGTRSATRTGTVTVSATLPSGTASRSGTATLTASMPTITATVTRTLTVTLPTTSQELTRTGTLPTQTLTLSATYSLPTRSPSGTESMTLPPATTTLTRSLPSATGTASLTVSFPTVTVSETRVLPTASESVTITQTRSLPTATNTGDDTITLPSASRTFSMTFTMPTRTDSISPTFSLPTQSPTPEISLTLPTLTQSPTLSLPTLTDSNSVTLTLATASPSFTLPTASHTVSVSLTYTVPSDTQTASESQTQSFSVPTDTVPVTKTAPLPTATSSDTVTLTVPTWTVSATPTMSMPSRTETETITRTVTLPTATLSRQLTATLPTVTRTISQTTTMPTASQTITTSATYTIPSVSVTSSLTLSLPTRTVTRTVTATVPTATASATATITLPEATRSLTLPTASASATLSLTLVSATETRTMTLTLPSGTETTTSTVTVSATLPTVSATSTDSLSMTLPSGGATESNTVTVPTETVSRTVSVTVPTVTSSDSATMTLPSGSVTESRPVTLTLPTSSATISRTIELPTATRSDTSSMTLPTETTTATASQSSTSTLSGTVTLPTATETVQPYSVRLECQRVGGSLRDLRDSSGQPLLLVDTASNPVTTEDSGDRLAYQTSAGSTGTVGHSAIWAYIGETVGCTIHPGGFTVLSQSAAVDYAVTVGNSFSGHTTAYRVREYPLFTVRQWGEYNATNNTGRRLPDMSFRRNQSDMWHNHAGGEVIFGDAGGSTASGADETCVQNVCAGNSTNCTLAQCGLVSTNFEVGYPCHGQLSPFDSPDRVWLTYVFKVTALDRGKRVGRDVPDGQWFDGVRSFVVFRNSGTSYQLIVRLSTGEDAPPANMTRLPRGGGPPVLPTAVWMVDFGGDLFVGDGFIVNRMWLEHDVDRLMKVAYEVNSTGTPKYIRSTAFGETQVLATTEKVYDVHYFYGTPVSLKVACSGDEERVHAWSITNANKAGCTLCGIGPAGESRVHEGHLAQCFVRGIDQWNNSVLPDPLRGDSVDTRSPTGFTDTYTVSSPQSALCTASGLSDCDPPVLLAGRAAYQTTVGEALVTIAPAVPLTQNVVAPHGPRTRYAYDPVGYGRATINFAMQSVSGTTQRLTVDVAGAFQPQAGWDVACSLDQVDPLVLDVYSECVITASTDQQDPQPAFAGDFFVSDRAAAEPTETLSTYLNITSVVRRTSSSVFASWSALTDPGFSFSFRVYAMPQDKGFDGVALHLYLNWRNSYWEPPGLHQGKSFVQAFPEASVCSGFTRNVTYMLLREFQMKVIVKASPELHFSCNGLECGGPTSDTNTTVAYFPALLSTASALNVAQLSTPLVINPYLAGNGVTSLSFQSTGSPVWCWQSEQYQGLTEIHTLRKCLPGDGADREQQFSFEPATGSLVIRRLPASRPADNTYVFTLTFTHNAAASGTVTVKYNSFTTPGSVSVPNPVLKDVYTPALVFCQDFVDVDAPHVLWIEGARARGRRPPEEADFEPITSAWQDYRFGEVADSADPFAVTSWAKADAVQVSEFHFQYIPLGDASRDTRVQNISLVGATASQSNANSPTQFAAQNLVDGKLTTQWIDYAIQPVIFKFEQVTRVDLYSWSTGSANPHRDPVQWTLEGSVDQSSWVMLHNRDTNYPTTTERSANINGSKNPAFFDISPWEVQYKQNPCTGCASIGPSEEFDTVEQCMWKCQRTCSDSACTYAGCSHINYFSTTKSCQRLMCQNGVSNGTQQLGARCFRLTAGFQYFRFTPKRMRETPMEVTITNPSPKENLTYHLRCAVADRHGAQAKSTNIATVDVLPMQLPVEPQVSDEFTNLLRLYVNASALAVDRLLGVAEVLQLLTASSGSSLLATAEEIMTALSGRLAVQIGQQGRAVHPVSAARVTDVLWQLIEVVNKRVSPFDPAVKDIARLGVNERVLDVLRVVTSPTQSRNPTARAQRNVVRSMQLVLASLQRMSDLTSRYQVTKIDRRAAAGLQSSLQVDEQDAKDAEEARRTAAATRVADKLLQTGCQLGSHVFSAAEGDAVLGGCASCDHCAEFGMPLTTCVDTAWNLRGRAVVVGGAATGQSFVRFQRNDADLQVGSEPKVIRLGPNSRVELQWPVALVAFQLGTTPRTYDHDSILLRGPPSYFCLVNHSQRIGWRVPFNVSSSSMDVAVQVQAVDKDKVPIAIARRASGAWDVSSCSDTAGKLINATPTSPGIVQQECRELAESPLPAEFAAVVGVTTKRCTPGDFPGCVAVEDTARSFDDCRCVQCTDKPRTSIEAADSPTGYYVTPIAEGKMCVPYQNFSCHDTEHWMQGQRADYTVLLAEQCTGGSVIAGHKCVCGKGKVCARGLCETVLRCNDTGSTSQCLASGLQQSPHTLQCTCPANFYCHNVTAQEKGIEVAQYGAAIEMSLEGNEDSATAIRDGVNNSIQDSVEDSAVRECVPLVGCTTEREVRDPLACANGTVHDRRSQRCVCPSTSYCDTAAHLCRPKGRCGEKPAQPAATFCWPSDGGQPQLIARTVNATSGEVVCACPDSLVCEPHAKMCTCPVCKNGGECLWPTTRLLQDLHSHECTCGEGYMGADCGETEPKQSQFISVRYPQGNYSGYSSMSSSSQGKAETAVRTAVRSELSTAFSKNSSSSRPLASVSDVGIPAVYFRQGSILVNVELSVWPSTWTGRASSQLTQAQVGVTISTELATQLTSGDLSSMGNLTSPAVSGVAQQCATISNCAFAPLPWDSCRCSLCISGYVPHPGYILPNETVNDTLRGSACVSSQLCTNADDCNGRGAASGIRALGCLCACAPDFSGYKCEFDHCLVSMDAWKAPRCGPRRCSLRDDGHTEIDQVAPIPGLCRSPTQADLDSQEILVIVVIVLIVGCFAFACTYYGLHHKCPWESIDVDFGALDDGSSVDDRESEAGDGGEAVPVGRTTSHGVSETVSDDQDDDVSEGRLEQEMEEKPAARKWFTFAKPSSPAGSPRSTPVPAVASPASQDTDPAVARREAGSPEGPPGSPAPPPTAASESSSPKGLLQH